MKRGRPFEPGNKFGRGRPKGSRNKKTHLAQKIFNENSAAIMALAINTSREDRQMLRMLASHIVSRQRDTPLKLGKLPMATLQDLDRASAVILNKATSGKIGLDEALDVCTVIETRRRVLMSVDVEQSLVALENGGRLLKEAA
jgi:hypothetical protein